MKKKQCEDCGGYGHLAERCSMPALAAKKKVEANQSSLCAAERGGASTVTRNCDGRGKVQSCLSEYETWLCDTGATTHMTNSRDKVFNFVPCKRSHVSTAGNDTLPISGYGELKVEFIRESKSHIVNLSSVAVVPTLRQNLFSVRVADEKGHKFEGSGGRIRLLDGKLEFRLRGKTYSALGEVFGRNVIFQKWQITPYFHQVINHHRLSLWKSIFFTTAIATSTLTC